MKPYIDALVGRIRDEEGQTFVEYALILGAISVVLVAAFALVATAVQTMLNTDIIPKL